MYLRFCLYTILRNQQFYAPFLLLALRDADLSFTRIGALYMVRSITVNLLEVPSGAVADRWGRRRTLALSMLAYCVSFLLLGLGAGFWTFAAAMVLYGVGEAFRSGTHKSMIYQWLALQGRKKEKVSFYGSVRSWGKIGAGVNVVAAGLLAAWTGAYTAVFLAAIVPYLLNALNVFTYPHELEGPAKRKGPSSYGEFLRKLWTTLRAPRMRSLLLRSVAFEGLFATTKDYVQPMIRTLLPAAVVLAWVAEDQRATVAVTAFYVVGYVLSSVASRRAGRLADRLASPRAAELFFWGANLLVFGGIGAALVFDSLAGVVAAFLLLLALQNLWKPINSAAFADEGSEEALTTVLSVQSQAKSLFAAALAPVLGLAIDYGFAGELYPVALLGLGLSTLVLGVTLRRRPPPETH